MTNREITGGDQRGTLPSGWAATTLGAIVSQAGESASPPFKRETTFIGLEHILPNLRKLAGTGSAADVRSTKSVFRRGDILYGKLRPYLNKVYLSTMDGVCSTDIVVFRPGPGIEGELVARLLSSQRFVQFASSVSAGSNLPRASFSKLRDFPLWLPPSAEQTRILERLTDLQREHDQARASLSEIPAQLLQTKQSLLSAAARGLLTTKWRGSAKKEPTGIDLVSGLRAEHAATKTKADKVEEQEPSSPGEETGLFPVPSTWEWAAAAEIVEPGADIVYGIVQPGPKLQRGVPYVRGLDIENGQIILDQLVKTSPAVAKRYARSSLKSGDVLLGIIRATKVAVVPPALEGGNITQGTARLRPAKGIRSAYLARFLESPEAQSWLHKHFRGIDMPGLNLHDVRRLPIPVPPVGEQDKIIELLDEAFSQLDVVAKAYEAAIADLNRLEEAVIDRAFTGRLTTQSPSDGNAMELLAQIETARKAMPQRSKKILSTAQRFYTRKASMPLIDQLRETFGSSPFTYEALRAKLIESGEYDYDQLRDELFKLLQASDKPGLKVSFDKKKAHLELVLNSHEAPKH